MDTDFLNILYLVLAICTVILTVFLSIFIIKGINFLGNLNKILGALNSMIDMANAFLIKPLQIIEFIIEYLGKILGSNKNEESKEEKEKKNNKEEKITKAETEKK